MAKIAYINGTYQRQHQAGISIEDRASLFSDAVYEVIAFYNEKLLDGDLHLQRLYRSLAALRIAFSMTPQGLLLIIRELIAKNKRKDGTVYIQISRGIAKRDHLFPKHTSPSLVMMITGAKTPKIQEIEQGVSVITTPDLRWARRDIKSVSLLANVLAKQVAGESGAREAWLVDEQGFITEGAVSNNFIVNEKSEIITHPENTSILGGVTRHVVLQLARNAGMAVVERPFSLAEAKAASEAFLTSTTSNVLPVVRIDNAPVADGKLGQVTRTLQALYLEHIYTQTGKK